MSAGKLGAGVFVVNLGTQVAEISNPTLILVVIDKQLNPG